VGEIFWAAQHLHWHGWTKLYQGDLEVPRLLVGKLNDIFKIYENDLCIMLKLLLNTGLLMESRQIDEAMAEIEKGIDFSHKISLGTSLIHMYACKARLHILRGEIGAAENSLKLADKISLEVETVPWQLTNLCRAKLECDIYRLQKAAENGNSSALRKYRKRAEKACRTLMRIAKKVPQNRTDAYRLRGVYCWIVNRQKAAFKWWNKSIREGERLGARLELSRTYFEIGNRLLETKSSGKELKGIKAEGYLHKARTLFEEMDLRWDLEKMRSGTGG
jgi:hypothetical protein